MCYQFFFLVLVLVDLRDGVGVLVGAAEEHYLIEVLLEGVVYWS